MKTITPAQRRILSALDDNHGQAVAHPDLWPRNDTLPLRNLLKLGLISHRNGAYDSYYCLTVKGHDALRS